MRTLKLVPSIGLLISLFCASAPAMAQVQISDASQDPSGQTPAGNHSEAAPLNEFHTQPSDWDFNLSASVDSGRAFKEQAFILTTHATNVDDFTVEWHDWCGELWIAQTVKNYSEKDAYLCHRWHLGAATFEANAAVFDVPHTAAIYRFRGAVSYPMGDKCTADGTFDVMRGGFKTEVAKIDASCSFRVMEHLTLVPMVQLSHDTAYKVTAFGYDIGLETDFLIHPLTLRAHVEGYQAISGIGPTGKPSGKIFGLSLNAHW